MLIKVNRETYESMLIARHSPEVHAKLRKASVGVAGLGGLGSQIAVALVRMGIGRLTGIDFDMVELSNINRQYYFMDQIGMLKTEALEDTLKRISLLTALNLINLKIGGDNVKGLFDSCDVIIEAFDDPHAKAALFDACRVHYPDAFYIGASGVAGYGNTQALKIKKMSEKVFVVGDFTSEARPGSGLMAGRVGVAAGIQADLAVQLIVEGVFDKG